MRGGMMIPDSFVTPQTSMIPSRKEEASKTEAKPVGVQPLSQRMNVAYDKFVNKVEPEKGIQGKDVVALGRLLLEIEQVKNNLQNIAQEVQASSRKKRELDEKEIDLLEDEEDKLTALGASFRGFRRRLAGVSALLAGKQFLEGDISGGVQSATLAVGALLPEIVKITSGLVLGGLIRGGGGRGVAAPRGGRAGLLPLLLAGGGLLGAGSFLGSRGGGDQRRFELTKRQALPQLLSRNDVRRFRLTTNRFDNLVSNVNNNKLNITNSAFTAGMQDETELPDDPTLGSTANFFEDFAKSLFGGESEGSDLEISGDPENLSSLPTDITSEDLALLTDESGEVVNLFNFDEDDGNNEQPTKVPTQVASSSNIFVDSEFSDNSKISYILQYGGGAVV